MTRRLPSGPDPVAAASVPARSASGLRCLAAAVLFAVLLPAPLLAQGGDGCLVLCAPALKLEPTLTVENLFDRPLVERLADGTPKDTVRLDRETVFEAVVALDIPTEVPRVGLTVESIWPPFVDDNALELEAELNLILLTGEETDGWLGMHFDVVDQFSPAERPGAEREYTHKLDFELDAAIAPLTVLPEGNWLRNVELEVSLDYLATGLPRSGDEAPPGDRRFLDDGSGWSLSGLLILPLAPLAQ